jgi:hypothetical protein
MVRSVGEGDALPLPDNPATIEPTGAAVDVLQVCHIGDGLANRPGIQKYALML